MSAKKGSQFPISDARFPLSPLPSFPLRPWGCTGPGQFPSVFSGLSIVSRARARSLSGGIWQYNLSVRMQMSLIYSMSCAQFYFMPIRRVYISFPFPFPFQYLFIFFFFSFHTFFCCFFVDFLSTLFACLSLSLSLCTAGSIVLRV